MVSWEERSIGVAQVHRKCFCGGLPEFGVQDRRSASGNRLVGFGCSGMSERRWVCWQAVPSAGERLYTIEQIELELAWWI